MSQLLAVNKALFKTHKKSQYPSVNKQNETFNMRKRDHFSFKIKKTIHKFLFHSKCQQFQREPLQTVTYPIQINIPFHNYSPI